MDNNYVLRSLSYTFKLYEAKIHSIFKLVSIDVPKEQITKWLAKDDSPEFVPCADIELANFLNGLIIQRRGKKDGPTPEAESRLTNNIILRKIKIALDLRNEDILAILVRADFDLSKPELTALFRKEGHKHYRVCKDQVLRRFLKGLQIKYG